MALKLAKVLDNEPYYFPMGLLFNYCFYTLQIEEPVMQLQMRHLVIFLPGFMGSVLQKDDKDVWALSGQAVWQYLRTAGSSLHQLRVANEDWHQNNLEDGIAATRIISDIYAVPGLGENAGYSVIIQRIKEIFDVTEGSIFQPSDDANFFAFPYDWRRDIRASALKLKNFVTNQLPRWRSFSGAKDAQVILIAHSMGGLVSRYYLEVLDGWRECRTLITVGTPHRGSLDALDKLSNGFQVGNKKLFSDLSTVIGSFPSLYQLLPSYPVIEHNGSYSRAADMNEIPNINQGRAKEARDNFLDAIRQSAIRNRAEPEYKQRTLPWVGTRQDTYQSALLSDGKLTLRYSPPAGVDEPIADGDGSVTRVSAIPPDLDGLGFERFAVERHGWLTNNAMTLEPIIDTLKQIAASGSQNLYGQIDAPRSHINLHLDKLYLPNEPVTIRVKQMSEDQEPQDLFVNVAPVKNTQLGISKQDLKINTNESKKVDFGILAPGLYQLTIGAQEPTPKAPTTVHGVLEVVDETSLE
jgi:pimeloyl-ACP methyl ester carboxylesterase